MNNRYKNAIFVGIISFLIQGVDRLVVRLFPALPITGFIFISFIVWGSYSLIDLKRYKALKLLGNYLIGYVIANLMAALSSLLLFTGSLANPLMALILVPFVMLLDILPYDLNKIPIYFIASGVYFALTNYWTFSPMFMLIIFITYVIIGILAAEITAIYFERIKNGTVKKFKKN